MQNVLVSLLKILILLSVYMILIGFVAIFVIPAFGFYGLSLTIIIPVLVYFSANFRDWLRVQPGFAYRLSGLPGLGSSNSSVAMAVGFAIYLFLLSMLGMFLINWAFASVSTAFFVAMLGLVGLLLIHGWYIRGWRTASGKNQAVESDDDKTTMYQYSRLPVRAVLGDLTGNKIGIGLTIFASALPVLFLLAIFMFGIVNEPLREIGMLPTYTPTATSTLPPTSTPIPTATNTPQPIPTEKPTNTPTPMPELAFADFIQTPDEKGWTSTQYSTYFDTIKGRPVRGWSGTIVEIDESFGRPYLSLDMKSGEPKIDAYVYINKEDVLKVGLGQDIKFNGVVDSKWPESNGFYALQIEKATLLELGEIPIPTQTPPAVTQVTKSEIPMDVQLYGVGVAKKTKTLGEALQELGRLLQNPKPGNDEWTIGVALQVTIIRLTHEELLAIDVPSEMTEIHAALLDATENCNTSMDYLVSGVDNLNSDDIDTANLYLVQCAEKLPKASVLMEEYLTNSSTPTQIDTASPTEILESDLEQTAEFSIISQWKPDENPNGFGADILLLEENLTQEKLISLVKNLGGDYDPVLIRIYTSQEAYDQELSGNYGDEWREGYVLFYVKNLTGSGLYSGSNEIRWMQETGQFADLFGQVTKF